MFSTLAGVAVASMARETEVAALLLLSVTAAVSSRGSREAKGGAAVW